MRGWFEQRTARRKPATGDRPRGDGAGLWRAVLLLSALVFPLPARSDEPPAPPDPGRAACIGVTGSPIEPRRVTVAEVPSGHTLVTSEGQMIRLSGIDAPHLHRGPAIPPETAEPALAARQALRDLLAGADVWVFPVTPALDRHHRLRARLVRAGDGTWIEAEMVRRGLGRVEPHPDDYACARYLQGLEAMARAAGLGLWADPEFRVLPASGLRLDDWVGRYVLIEGRVVSTGVSGTRRYLNFGKDFRSDFAIVLDDKNRSPSKRGSGRTPGRFAAEGFDAPDIVGKEIRIRGVLTLGGGGLMVPSVPEELEWVTR